MTSNMSTAERLVKLHDTMVDNIEAMGGTVDSTKTLIEIAGAILDIPPTVVGIELDTSITCASNKQTVAIQDTVTFTGQLKAFYDDETQADVDLEGVLQGATVKIYNGNSLLGTCTTDNNGDYTYTHTVTTANDLAIKAVFDGTDDYKDSYSSTVNVTVTSYTSIEVSTDKSILSYADGDKATLYAQLKDSNDQDVAIAGVTITFSRCDSQGQVITTLGTADTDSSGKATLTDGYTSQGLGDVYMGATDGTLLIQTYTLEDCKLYVDGSSNAHFPTATSSSGWLVGANDKIPIDNAITLPSSFEINYKGYVTTTNGWTLIGFGESGDNCNNYAGGQFLDKGAFLRKGWTGTCSGTYLIKESNRYNLNEETSVVYQYDNGTHKLVIGNSEYTVTNSDYTPTYFLGIGLPASTGKIKELKIKPL